jgi:hypothetical protein
MNKINGILKVKYDEVQLTEKFKKREFVIQLASTSYNGSSEYLKFSLIMDSCSMIDSFSEGDSITVSYEVKAREWINPENETVYINDVKALSIKENVEPTVTNIDMSGEGQDLPF